MSNNVTLPKPYRFHAGDAFEGFPLRWAQPRNILSGIPTVSVRIIPHSEVLESADMARARRSKELLAMMFPSNVSEWTWCEHPDGSWRAHHSSAFEGDSQ